MKKYMKPVFNIAAAVPNPNPGNSCTTSQDDMTLISKLSFAVQSKRQQDMEFAEQQGFSLALKIKTRFIKGVDNKCKAVIDNYLYDVSYVDATRTELYFYLQGVGELAGTD